MSQLSQPNCSLEPAVTANFQSPPVVETALSAQFSGVKWGVAQFGQYHERVKERYTKFLHQHEVPPMIETFPLNQSGPSFNLTDRPPVGRGIYAADDDSHLVQIQDNRFGFNWKRASADSPYPRFDANLTKFNYEFERFTNFCTELGIGIPTPTFCEVVYVNQIKPREDESAGALFDAAFKGVEISGDLDPELVTLNRTFVLGEKEGRLYAEAGVVLAPKPVVTFKLTSRLRLNGEDLAARMRQAHDWLIETFLKLTTDDCRKERWGQK